MARRKSSGSKSQKLAGNGSKRSSTARRTNGHGGRAKRSLIARLKFW
jgi:hypothetical protein